MSTYIILLYLGTGITLTLAAQAWFRRGERATMALFFLLVSMAISSFSYAMNLTAPDLAQKIFWNHAEYLGAPYLPTLMLVVALVVTGRNRWLRPTPLAALFAAPCLAMLANSTNDWHGLYYSRIWIEPIDTFLILAKERGQLYALYCGYAYVAIGLSLFFIIRTLCRPGLTPRPQLVLLLLAFLAPFLFNIPYTFRLMPHKHVNLTLAGFFVSSILISIAIFRYRLISALPLDEEERNQLLLHHSNALLYTIRPDGVFTYVSPNWPLVLGHAPEEVVGKSFAEFVLPADHAACHAFLERVVSTGELQTGAEYRVIHKDGRVVWHTSSIIPVKDKKGRLLAYIGAAHDITRMKYARQELSEANKRLSDLIASRETELRKAVAETLDAEARADRRIGEDIHDGLCQELVGLARLAECAEQAAPDVAAIGQIREQAVRLAGVARDFSHNLALQELDVQTIPEALETLARRTDQLFRTETELNLYDQLNPLSHEQNLHVYRIIREAIANAVKHAQAQRLWIDLVREPGQLIVSVSNDGLPLPETANLTDGLGMKQMRMRARLLGAEFSIRRNDRQLTVVELIIPVPESDTA